jgi:DUF2975 family protein
VQNETQSRAVRWGHAIVNLMLAFALLFGAYRAVTTGLALAGVHRSSIDVQLQIPRESIRVPPKSHFVAQPNIKLHIEHPTKAQTALQGGIDLGPLVLFVIGLWLLRAITGSVRNGDPFVPDNVRRLRGIGFVLVVGSLFLTLFDMALRNALFNRIPPVPDWNLAAGPFGPPGSALVAGLGVFILAEVFAHGVRLREDVEATI